MFLDRPETRAGSRWNGTTTRSALQPSFSGSTNTRPIPCLAHLRRGASGTRRRIEIRKRIWDRSWGKRSRMTRSSPRVRRSGGLQAAVRRAKGSKEQDFGLEAKATSSSRIQMKFQLSLALSILSPTDSHCSFHVRGNARETPSILDLHRRRDEYPPEEPRQSWRTPT